jgi:hypothetical protein
MRIPQEFFGCNEFSPVLPFSRQVLILKTIPHNSAFSSRSLLMQPVHGVLLAGRELRKEAQFTPATFASPHPLKSTSTTEEWHLSA